MSWSEFFGLNKGVSKPRTIKDTPINSDVKDLPIKDPQDWTLTDSSTEWETKQRCVHCWSITSHNERMAHVCNNCGYVERGLFDEMCRFMPTRKIWNGEKWVYQVKYSGHQYYIVDELIKPKGE